ncbi:11820_t:CDS:2, partial [Scutellospora calospora]
NDLVNILNDTPFRVEEKHKGFVPFMAKYVILTAQKWDDDIEKRTTEIIFHQGSEEDFRNINWMVKLRNRIHTNEEVIEKSKKINNDGEHI